MYGLWGIAWPLSIHYCMVTPMTERLSKEDWLQHGFMTLATNGHAALKADPLCKALGVSRGSFYWHFKDIGDFQDQLATRWYEMVTENVIQQIDTISQTQDKLTQLMQTAMLSDPRLERAVRVWAADAPKVQALVAKTDARRITFIQSLLNESTLPAALVPARARMVYCTYLGDTVLGHDVTGPFGAKEIAGLAEMILTP